MVKSEKNRGKIAGFFLSLSWENSDYFLFPKLGKKRLFSFPQNGGKKAGFSANFPRKGKSTPYTWGNKFPSLGSGEKKEGGLKLCPPSSLLSAPDKGRKN